LDRRSPEAAVSALIELSGVEEVSMCTKAAALIVLFTAVAPAATVESQEPKSTVREVVTLTGIVERTDRSTRGLTLRTSQNTTQTIYVDPEIALFDELKNGDRITVRLYESVIVAVRPGLKPSVAVDTTAGAKGATGQGQVLQQLKAAVTVESVDPRNNAITYKTADNRRVIRTVADPRLLEGVKAGDVIEITHTRERVIDLQRMR
jgi:hypothetical protein